MNRIAVMMMVAAAYAVLALLSHRAIAQSTAIGGEPPLSCDQQRHMATIFPPKNPEQAYRRQERILGESRCQLNGDIDVLVRWSQPGRATADGDELFITRMSVWVNRVKWVDAVVIDEDGSGEEAFMPPDRLEVPARVQISSKGMTICNRLLYGQHPWAWLSNAHCSFIPLRKLPKEPDFIEFPAKDKQRPATGTKRILQSQHDPLCSAIVPTVSNFRIRPSEFGAEDLDVEDPPHAKYPVGSGLVMSFDIDNSGQPQLVVENTEWSGVSSTERYLVYTETGLQKLAATKYKDSDDVARNAEQIYPDLWDICEAGGEVQCAPNNRNWLPFTAKNAEGEAIHFRDEYVSMTPFRYGGLTYFAIHTADTDKANITFIVKPLPMGRYELTCSLELVDLHL